MKSPSDSPGAYRGPGANRQSTPLRDGRNAAAVPAVLDEASLQRLLGQLQALTTESLEQALKKFFSDADECLFEMARGASNNRDQARFLEVMRSLRSARTPILQRFVHEIERSFQTPVLPQRKVPDRTADVDSLVLTDSADLEKTIAINNIANRAAEVNKQLLWELGRRLNTLAHAQKPCLPAQAVAPITFCEAFRVAVDSLNLDVGHALVLYPLFDRMVMPELGRLYAGLLGIFDQYSIRPGKVTLSAAAERAVPEPVPGSSRPAPAVPEPMPPPMPSGAVPTVTPAERDSSFESPAPRAPGQYTLEMLQRLRPGLRGSSSPQIYTDQNLADDLIGAALGRLVPGWEPAHAKAYVRRTDAVGQMFTGITDDPDMPAELKSRFDELRFAVVKTALQDVGFFANPQHPVRSLVNDLAALAASARSIGVGTLKRIGELVGQIQDQFRVAAETVRRPRVDPLEHIEIERFLTEQLERNRQRRKDLLEKAKRVVEEELQLRCQRHNVPNTAVSLLRSGWAPMMASHLLRSGIDCPGWREGLELLEGILAAMDPALPSPAGGPAAIVASIDQQLSAAGMIATRRKELLDAFLPALGQAETKRRATRSSAPQSSPAITMGAEVGEAALLQALIVPGNWFHIVDPATSNHRWMKAVTHYPDHNNIAFAEFNGRNPLYIDLPKFFDGLVSKAVEPLELMPLARDLLDRYVRQRQSASA